MPDARKTCLHCGNEHSTYHLAIQETDERRRPTGTTLIYWCPQCRKESRYPDGSDEEE